MTKCNLLSGILGLRIAPPEAPATGYMFGKGVYFADMFSKSANYCYASNALTTGVLLLCEVIFFLSMPLPQGPYQPTKTYKKTPNLLSFPSVCAW